MKTLIIYNDIESPLQFYHNKKEENKSFLNIGMLKKNRFVG